MYYRKEEKKVMITAGVGRNRHKELPNVVMNHVRRERRLRNCRVSGILLDEAMDPTVLRKLGGLNFVLWLTLLWIIEHFGSLILCDNNQKLPKLI